MLGTGSQLSRRAREVDLRRLATHSVAPARRRYRAQAPSLPRFERAEPARTSFGGTRRHLCRARPRHRLCRVRLRSCLDHGHLDRRPYRQRRKRSPADTDPCLRQPVQFRRGLFYPLLASSVPFLSSEVISAPSSSQTSRKSPPPIWSAAPSVSAVATDFRACARIRENVERDMLIRAAAASWSRPLPSARERASSSSSLMATIRS